MQKPDILLINPPYHKRNNSGSVFPLGLGYLSSSLKKSHHTVQILDCASEFSSLHENTLKNFEVWLLEKINLVRPKYAIGVGPCTTPAIRGIKIIADTCYKNFRNLPIVFGGPLASIVGQESLFFDYLNATAIISGDGEIAICEFLNAIKSNQPIESLKTVTTKKNINPVNVIQDLDSLDFPDRGMVIKSNKYKLSTRRFINNNSFFTMTISRGCPYNCSFCVSGSLRNNEYHRRSLENIVDEIKEIVFNYKVNSIVFYDDSFFPSPKKLHEDVYNFTNSINKNSINFSWQIEMRPNVLLELDVEHVKMLYKSGCRQINVGFESAEPSKSDILKKKIEPEKIISKCNLITSKFPLMRLSGTFIIGWPGETPESIDKTIEYSKLLNLTFAHFYPLKLYPGTFLYKEIFKDKDPLYWFNEIQKDPLPWGELIYLNGNFNKFELLKQIEKAYKSFYDRKEWTKMIDNKFGANSKSIIQQVSIWSIDRFNFNT